MIGKSLMSRRLCTFLLFRKMVRLEEENVQDRYKGREDRVVGLLFRGWGVVVFDKFELLSDPKALGEDP